MVTPLTFASTNLEVLRALNNEHARELSFADEGHFRHLIANAFFARSIGTVSFLIAFDQDGTYLSENFLWFRKRFQRFIYVDRIVTADHARGRGHAATLYNALFSAARAAGHECVTCEINAEPPNPVSEAFHAKFEFVQACSAELPGRGKSVRYFVKKL
jgi:predicted GNAT superfamily acetyltransferase